MLRGIELLPVAAGFECFKPLVNRLTLPQLHPELDDLALYLLVGLAQCLAVFHAHEMTHCPPSQAEAVFNSLQWLDQPAPSRLELGFEPLQLSVGFVKQLTDGRSDVFRMNRGKIGQRCKLQ